MFKPYDDLQLYLLCEGQKAIRCPLGPSFSFMQCNDFLDSQQSNLEAKTNEYTRIKGQSPPGLSFRSPMSPGMMEYLSECPNLCSYPFSSPESLWISKSWVPTSVYSVKTMVNIRKNIQKFCKERP